MLNRVIKSILVLIACLLVLISFTPMLLSVSQINQFLISCLNNRIAGKLHAQEILVGWTDGISVKGLQIHDPQGREVALFKKISCDVALLSLIHAPAIVGKIQVDSPKIKLIDDKNNGHFSLEQVFSQEPKAAQEQKTSGPTELTLSDLHLAIDIQPQGQAKINLLCQIENTDAGTTEKGSVNLTATAQNFADLEKAYKSALGQTASSPAASVVTLDCYIDQFPLKAAMPFINMADPKLASLILPALGNKINAKIAHTLRGDELGLAMLLNTPQLAAKLKASIKGNNLTIKDEGSLSWQIRPEVLAALARAYPAIPADIQQQKTTTLLATVQPQSGTLGADGKMPLAISWNLDSPLTLTSPDWNTPLACKMLGNITATALQETVEAHTQVEVATGKETTNLEALCTINHPLANPETLCKASLNGPIAQQAALFLQQKLPLVELLGKTTSLEATCKMAGNEKSGHIQLQSETIKSDIAFTLEDDRIKIAPSTLALRITPEAINALAPSEKSISAIPLSLAITSAEIPFDKSLFTKEMSLNAALKMDSYTITSSLESIELKDSSVTLVKNKGQHLVVTSNTTADLQNASAKFQELLGKTLTAKAVLPVEFEDNKLTISTTDATLSSEKFLASIQNMKTLINLDTKEVTGNILVKSDKTTFETTYSSSPQDPSSYNLLPQTALLFEGRMHDFPVELLATLSQKPQLSDLLGHHLSGSWKIGFNNALSKEPIILSLKGDGLLLQANLELAKSISGSDSCLFDYELTQKRFTALQSFLQLAQSEKQKELQLAKPLKVHAKLKEIRFPLEQFVQEAKPLVLANVLDALQLQFLANLEEIKLSQKDKKDLTVSPLKIAAMLSGKDRLITFSCDSDKIAHEHAATISVKGTAHNLWNDQGIQVDNARILLDTKIQNLPLDMFYSITANPQTADKLIALLGHKVDANLKGEIKELHEGTFSGSIESPRLKSHVACLLKEGTLTLEKPITAEYTLTPEAGEVLLKDVNPLLVTAARTQSPIKLHIDSKDFSIPLKPFSLETMSIKNIKIEPGILTCKNGGMLSLLVNLLRVNVSPDDEVDLWFTPIYVEIKDGIVNCKRSDTLFAGGYPIATWGKINLIKNSIDMTLGLSGTAIAKAFDIPRLDPGYMVQIPIHGTTQSPKIDTALATTKITALKLQKHKSNTTSLIGGLLEVATTIVEKDAPIPAPTTQPFPWTTHKR